MRRTPWGLFAVAALLAGGCGGGSTTQFCDPACQIWKDCGTWDYNACMSDCKTAGNWDQGYVNCLKAATCTTLNTCG
ncbi:MAG TPA: hypothetical protein VMH40_00200 [Myxococcaceae bacterium]|nr:hypothetical protein [Myxococcaceae bacterium]